MERQAHGGMFIEELGRMVKYNTSKPLYVFETASSKEHDASESQQIGGKYNHHQNHQQHNKYGDKRPIWSQKNTNVIDPRIQRFLENEDVRLKFTEDLYKITKNAPIILRDIFKYKKLEDRTPAIIKLFSEI